jgi:hypothetical protein
MAEQADATNAFLDYLDKEMTIMGILSTFCIAAAALVIDRVASADKASFFKSMLADHPVQIFVGSGLLIAAGLFFYLQRSHLAHLYGSTCISMAAPSATEWTTDRWLVEAYTFATWLRYRIGFFLLTMTAIVYAHAIYQQLCPAGDPYLWQEVVLIATLVILLAGQLLILFTYRYSNHPYRSFSFRTFKEDWQNRDTPLAMKRGKIKPLRKRRKTPG